MFEVGKDYRITTGEVDERGYSVYTVIEVAMPLIKVEDGGGTKIINTHAPSFIEAEPFDRNPESQAEFAMTDGGFTDRGDEDDPRNQAQADRGNWRIPPTGY